MKVQYQPTITFGNITTLISMLGTLAGLYITHERRISILETEMRPLLPVAVMVNELNVNQKFMSKAIDRIENKIQSK